MNYTLTEAYNYSKAGKIEEWLHSYFQAEGDNIPLFEGLQKARRHYSEIINLPLSRLERCCGPEEGMSYQVGVETFERSVNDITKRYRSGWDMPPLFVEYDNQRCTLSDGNHRLEALRRMGHTHYAVIFWCTGFAARDKMKLYLRDDARMQV